MWSVDCGGAQSLGDVLARVASTLSLPAPGDPLRALKALQVAQSRDVSTVLLLVAGTLALSSPLGAGLVRLVYQNAQRMWSGILIRPQTIGDFHAVLLDASLLFMTALAPFAGIYLVVGVASNVTQIGWMLSAEALEPKLEKMNPIQGMKKFVSLDRLYELAKALLRLVVVVAVLVWLLAPAMPDVLGHIGADVVSIGVLGGDLLRKTIWAILTIFAIFAVVDYVW